MPFQSRSSSRSPYRRSTFGLGPRTPYAARGRSRQRSGFSMRGPFPTYSTRTRRGSRVQVSGCCLPIPLALTLGTGALAVRGVRALR